LFFALDIAGLRDGMFRDPGGSSAALALRGGVATLQERASTPMAR